MYESTPNLLQTTVSPLRFILAQVISKVDTDGQDTPPASAVSAVISENGEINSEDSPQEATEFRLEKPWSV